MVSYLLREWLPKLMRAVLARKYDWGKSDYTGLVTFLELVVALVARNLSADNEVVHVAAVAVCTSQSDSLPMPPDTVPTGAVLDSEGLA